jgi:DNA-binding response OmpR family regulator
MLQHGHRKNRLFVDPKSRRVWINEKEVLPPLSVPQFRMLQILYNQPGTVVSRQELVLTIWGDREALGISEQALDALVRRLRERLAGADPNHEYIVTVRGHGVRLENPEI